VFTPVKQVGEKAIASGRVQPVGKPVKPWSRVLPGAAEPAGKVTLCAVSNGGFCVSKLLTPLLSVKFEIPYAARMTVFFMKSGCHASPILGWKLAMPLYW